MKKFKSVSEECENIHLKLNQVKPHRGGQTPPIDLGPSSLSLLFLLFQNSPFRPHAVIALQIQNAV